MEEKYDEAKLLECFDPVLSWAETPCLMRTWRPIRGEGMELDDLVSDALKADGISEEEFSRRKYELRSFDVGRLLGEGNYTQVFCATLRCTQEEYAFKIVDKAKVKRYHKENDVLIEKWVLSNVQHPGMVKLFHTFQDVGALYLVLDLVEGGELWNYTHGRGIRQSLAAFYTAEILEVLQHLHEHKVVHRDVKPENVLVTKTGHIKLIDFGTAKVLTEEWTGKQPKGKWKEFVGTPEYMAPEAINNVPSDYRFDLWSLGCVICQLLSGQPPFKGKSDFLTFKRVARCAYLMPEGMPPAAASMIRQLLVINAPERLGGGAEIDEPEAKRHAAIRSHPWFVEQLAGCATQLHERSLCVSAPLPVASLQELCAPIVGERLAEAGDWQSAAMRGPPVQEWPQSVRQQVVFELTKRRKLSERRMRDAMLLGPEPVGISDAEIVREDMGEAEAMEDGDAKEKKKGGGGDADAAGVLV